MQFVHRIRQIWSWLPAFRAVAETQHLPTAARQLGIVPSALSRTIKRLEDELGIVLFERQAKALVLNDAGRELLAAVRDAMRLLDDATTAMVGDELSGTATAVACSDLAHVVLAPACAALSLQHPKLRAATLVAESDAMPGMLIRGDADVAITLEPAEVPELEFHDLAQWSRSVYGRAASNRCVVVGPPTEQPDDGWPVDTERVIVVWASDQRAALDIAARSDLVTVAFDVLGGAPEYASRLQKLPSPAIPPRTLYLAQRRSIGLHRRTDALVAAVRSFVSS